MRLTVMPLLIACSLLSGCATPIEAGVDYDAATDFSAYRAFTWVSDRPMVIAGAEVDPLTQHHVQTAVERELGAKGYWLERDPDRADFAIAFTVGSRQDVDLGTYPTPSRQRWLSGPWSGTAAQAPVYPRGALAIDLFDLTTRRAVWHGWVTADITDQRLGNPLAPINDAVAAILAEFPPGGNNADGAANTR